MIRRIIMLTLTVTINLGIMSCSNNSNQLSQKPTTVTVEVKGTVDGIDNSLGLLDNSVFTGATITAIYKINLAASASPYSQPHMADYFDAFGANDVSITVGNYSFKSGASTQLTMVDGATNADGLFDGWYLYLPSSIVSGPTISANLTGFISLYDPSASALSSTALLPVPDLISWSSNRIGVSRDDSSGSHLFIVGEITELKVVQ